MIRRVTSRRASGSSRNTRTPSAIEMKVRFRPKTMRTGNGRLWKRTRYLSKSLSIRRPSNALVLALRDEACGCPQHVALFPEDRKRRIGARQQIADAPLGAVDAELGDEGGLAQSRIGAGRLAGRGGIALDVEQVVGDLEVFAERAAVIVERLILFRRGLAEDRA